MNYFHHLDAHICSLSGVLALRGQFSVAGASSEVQSIQRFTYSSENSIRRGSPLVTLRYLAKGEPHRLACLFKLHARIDILTM